MKESVFFKKYFSLLNVEDLSKEPSSLFLQLSFFSNNEIILFRQLIFDFNKKFNKKIVALYFFNQSSLTGFKDKKSSFNFVFVSSNYLAALAFFDMALRLNLGFSVMAFSSKFNNTFSINFFKSFLGNKFLANSVFLKRFAERLLFFLKKIEFYNTVRFLSFLKRTKA